MRKAKILLATGALLLATVTIASAKVWEVSMASVTKAGSLMLPAGTYTIKLENNNQALFTQEGSGKQFKAAVKVETAPTKFGQTAVETLDQGGQSTIKSIDLGGTTEMLKFTE